MTESQSFEDVRYETAGAVAEVTLDRPEKRNAIRPRTIEELDAARSLAEADDEVGALVVRSGSPGVFSAGADLSHMMSIIDDSAACEAFFEDLNGLYNSFEESSLGVVAGVTGTAMAGGLELVLACDLAVASADAEFGDQHINVNLMAAGGGSQRLPMLVGPRRAKELVLTGKTVPASTARDWGLVNEVVEDDGSGETTREAARSLAEDVARHHPRVVRRSKDLIRTGMDVPLAAGLEYERMTSLAHMQSEEAQAALERFS